MCRNIRTLHNFEPPATDEEIRASALQYVRKVSGSTKPSQANAEAFDRAVEEVTRVTARLLDELVAVAPPKDREVEAAKRLSGLSSASPPDLRTYRLLSSNLGEAQARHKKRRQHRTDSKSPDPNEKERHVSRGP